MQFVGRIQQNPSMTTARPSRSQQDSAQSPTLLSGQTQTIEARPGLEVRATSGVLWLTQEGEAGDTLLRPGQQWQASRAGRVVIQAIANNSNWTTTNHTSPTPAKNIFATLASLWA
ncbi:DUF2917 domain-containing protein [bacterium]|nr:MAG: DUF2917 domain-containing protein [bacterium]